MRRKRGPDPHPRIIQLVLSEFDRNLRIIICSVDIAVLALNVLNPTSPTELGFCDFRGV